VKNTEKPFRLAAKKLELTYPQVSPDMTHLDVIASLSKVIDYDKYLISKETHKGGGVHFHVVLTARTKFDIKSCTLLDLQYQGNTYHGKYETIKCFNKCVEYICKRGEYQTNMEDILDGKIVSPQERFQQIFKEKGIDEAKLWYYKTHFTLAAGGKSNTKMTKAIQEMEYLEAKINSPEDPSPFQNLEQ